MGNKLSSQQLRLQERRKSHDETVQRLGADTARGYRKPGSMNGKKTRSIKRLRGRK